MTDSINKTINNTINNTSNNTSNNTINNPSTATNQSNTAGHVDDYYASYYTTAKSFADFLNNIQTTESSLAFKNDFEKLNHQKILKYILKLCSPIRSMIFKHDPELFNSPFNFIPGINISEYQKLMNNEQKEELWRFMVRIYLYSTAIHKAEALKAEEVEKAEDEITIKKSDISIKSLQEEQPTINDFIDNIGDLINPETLAEGVGNISDADIHKMTEQVFDLLNLDDSVDSIDKMDMEELVKGARDAIKTTDFTKGTFKDNVLATANKMGDIVNERQPGILKNIEKKIEPHLKDIKMNEDGSISTEQVTEVIKKMTKGKMNGIDDSMINSALNQLGLSNGGKGNRKLRRMMSKQNKH